MQCLLFLLYKRKISLLLGKVPCWVFTLFSPVLHSFLVDGLCIAVSQDIAQPPDHQGRVTHGRFLISIGGKGQQVRGMLIHNIFLLSNNNSLDDIFFWFCIKQSELLKGGLNNVV